tara:strand:+ start:792 stop:1124 length:333 start_codon:yes stop_codon:yes gene_type:complete
MGFNKFFNNIKNLLVPKKTKTRKRKPKRKSVDKDAFPVDDIFSTDLPDFDVLPMEVIESLDLQAKAEEKPKTKKRKRTTGRDRYGNPKKKSGSTNLARAIIREGEANGYI